MIIFYAELANVPETASTKFHASITITHSYSVIILVRGTAAAILFDDLIHLLHSETIFIIRTKQKKTEVRAF